MTGQNVAKSTLQTGRIVRLLLAAGLLAIFAAGRAGPATPDAELARKINEAGLQRMLSQQIVLAYAKIGLGVSPDASHQQLQDAIALFERQLAELADFAPTGEIKEAVAAVERVWRPFRTVAAGPVTHEGARRLWHADEDLLYASHKVVRLLQDLSDAPYARLVNISGRQRMLSQRLAKLYMLREWGFDTHTLRDDIEAARIEFAGALETLRAAPENTNTIQMELDNVALQWAWFENALTLTGEQSFRLVAADSSRTILEGLDRITGQYEQLGSAR